LNATEVLHPLASASRIEIISTVTAPARIAAAMMASIDNEVELISIVFPYKSFYLNIIEKRLGQLSKEIIV
jgi:hypothetical protein